MEIVFCPYSFGEAAEKEVRERLEVALFEHGAGQTIVQFYIGQGGGCLTAQPPEFTSETFQAVEEILLDVVGKSLVLSDYVINDQVDELQPS